KPIRCRATKDLKLWLTASATSNKSTRPDATRIMLPSSIVGRKPGRTERTADGSAARAAWVITASPSPLIVGLSVGVTRLRRITSDVLIRQFAGFANKPGFERATRSATRPLAIGLAVEILVSADRVCIEL